MNKYDTIQKRLDECSPLYLDGYEKEYSFENCEIKDFILHFLLVLCAECHTYNAKTGKVESKPSKRRSLGDIYRLCKYYYDNVTVHEVQYWLAILWRKKKIGYFYCNNNEKRVYMSLDFYKTHSVNPKEYPDPDEYGITPSEIELLSKQKADQFNYESAIVD